MNRWALGLDVGAVVLEVYVICAVGIGEVLGMGC